MKLINKDETKKEELLVVPKRPSSIAPASLIKNIDKYKSGTIFIRRGPEVGNATSADISFLFGKRDLGDDENSSSHLTYFLPQRPNTIEKFVGRVSILAELLKWITLKTSQENFCGEEEKRQKHNCI